MVNLSQHFIDNWIDRVGACPEQADIVEIINDSIRVVKGARFELASGNVATQLAVYWNPVLDLVITVDPFKKKAVSVLTPDIRDFRNQVRREKASSPAYTPMTMHRR